MKSSVSAGLRSVAARRSAAESWAHSRTEMDPIDSCLPKVRRLAVLLSDLDPVRMIRVAGMAWLEEHTWMSASHPDLLPPPMRSRAGLEG